MQMSYLFVDAEDPAFDVGVVAVGHVVDGEDRPVLDRTATVRPKSRVGLNLLKLIHFLVYISGLGFQMVT